MLNIQTLGKQTLFTQGMQKYFMTEMSLDNNLHFFLMAYHSCK
jgi:hypothetical protein